ncbi:MAG: ACT domain-containing protein, partial [Candidatus Omnitrophica bacterium]|nr:ACT domain-containing protein [Candidatus Omnitrophota bacterium]
YKTAPVTLSFVNGLLKPILGETVNYINALDIAKERAIDVQEIISTRAEEFTNCIKVEIKTDKLPFFVLGALSGNNQPRIVKINQVYVEAIPEGNILFIHNNDKPGLVGAVGTILGEGHINIAGITLGTQPEKGTAISVVNVDSEVPDSIVARLKATPNILYIKALKV